MINNLTISQIFVTDQDEALDFYVNTLGLEPSADVDSGPMRWLTVRVPGTDREILLEQPGPPGYDPETVEAVRVMVSKGASGGTLIFSTDDARAAHGELVAKGVDLPEEPTEQPYGIDFGFRDPAGNHIRITEPRPLPPGFGTAG
ncbi:VOC family protein [Occultella glacieicola]|uniref:VOC family protein n=1 Tax=Occultella glacieicola TaxID=2518684 RepID=A0ABY2E115_9MICO|nr:VOC family protein [Occultella glacieicola]TDE91622.1 VOC family protein [Occultella glacieicola]